MSSSEDIQPYLSKRVVVLSSGEFVWQGDEVRNTATLPPEPVFWKAIMPEDDIVPTPEPVDDVKGSYLKSYLDDVVNMLQRSPKFADDFRLPGIYGYADSKDDNNYNLWWGLHNRDSPRSSWQRPAGTDETLANVLSRVLPLLTPVGRERAGDMVEEQMPVKAPEEDAATFEKMLPIRKQLRHKRLENGSLMDWLDFYLRPPGGFRRRYTGKFITSDGKFVFWYRLVALGDPAAPANMFGSGEIDHTAFPHEAQEYEKEHWALMLEDMETKGIIEPWYAWREHWEDRMKGLEGESPQAKIPLAQNPQLGRPPLRLSEYCEVLRKSWKKSIRPLDMGIPYRFGGTGYSCQEGLSLQEESAPDENPRGPGPEEDSPQEQSLQEESQQDESVPRQRASYCDVVRSRRKELQQMGPQRRILAPHPAQVPNNPAPPLLRPSEGFCTSPKSTISDPKKSS
ncbi:MAG: hypothetical protein M1831_003702 [Alyxoria varia]|nr:MAG: hypothetical protein M1831_003702 [Alyxoria varia]